jgi:hypothetical protein
VDAVRLSRDGTYRTWSRQARRSAALLLALVLSASQVGCVQRRFLVRSNPPGARVFVDDYEIGTTPIATDFVYYGTRKIRLVKDGYETLTVLQPMPAPWYEYPVLDFISENVVLNKIHDDRVLDYQLQPQLMVPEDQLRARAEELRRNTQVPQFAPAGVIQSGAVQGVPFQPGQPGGLPPGTLPPPPLQQSPVQQSPVQQAPVQQAPVQAIPGQPSPSGVVQPGGIPPSGPQPPLVPPRSMY